MFIFPLTDWQDLTSLEAAIRLQEGDDLIDSNNCTASLNRTSCCVFFELMKETRSTSSNELLLRIKRSMLGDLISIIDFVLSQITYHSLNFPRYRGPKKSERIEVAST